MHFNVPGAVLCFTWLPSSGCTVMGSSLRWDPGLPVHPLGCFNLLSWTLLASEWKSVLSLLLLRVLDMN